MPSTLSQELSLAAARLDFETLHPGPLETIRRGFIDTVAVMIAGASEAAVQNLRQALVQADQGDATLYFSTIKTTPPLAAWINGAASHALDYDDFARGHPSSVLVPALLSEGESLGASGKDLITAYAAGYSTWMNIVARERDTYQIKGWHPTSLVGAIASAVACARLRQLAPQEISSAIGLAAAQASGITASYGSMAKSMQVGKAAFNGVISARLAAAGMIASDDVLDHSRGFLFAISPQGRVDLEPHTVADANQLLEDIGLSVKRYPFCYCAHRLIDGALDLVRTHSFIPNQIVSITAHISAEHKTILKNHLPQNAGHATFSAEFAIAASIIARNVGFEELTDEFVLRSDVQSLMKKVRIATTSEYDPDFLGFGLADRVEIDFADGRCLDSGWIRYPLGHAHKPMGLDDLKNKFDDCLRRGLAGVSCSELFNKLRALEGLSSVQELYRP